jgi:uncharacterized protein (TIGR02646 family)
MIRITKLSEPKYLADRKEAWTKEYLAANDEQKRKLQGRYNHEHIKAQLELETSKKCAYCESWIMHIDYGDIEHIAPKNSFPEKIYDWANLTLACSVCNTNKGAYWSDTASLLNPYTDNIEAQIEARGPWLSYIPGQERGKISLLKLALNRPELLERRRERLEKLQPLVDAYVNASAEIKEILKPQLEEELNSNREYIATVRPYLTSYIT